MSASDVLTYRGYAARIAFDAADETIVGHLSGIDDLISFQAQDARALRAAFQEAVDDYVATCAAMGRPAQQPYPGTMTLRVAPEVHARAALAARLSGKGMDRWGEEALSAAAEAATG